MLRFHGFKIRRGRRLTILPMTSAPPSALPGPWPSSILAPPPPASALLFHIAGLRQARQAEAGGVALKLRAEELRK